MQSCLFTGSAAAIAAAAGHSPSSATVFGIVVAGLAILALCAVAGELSAILGRLWDDPIAGLALLAGLGLLIWGLVSHNELVAVIGGLAAGAGLLGIELH